MISNIELKMISNTEFKGCYFRKNRAAGVGKYRSRYDIRSHSEFVERRFTLVRGRRNAVISASRLSGAVMPLRNAAAGAFSWRSNTRRSAPLPPLQQ
jgi:hypothetical protein